MAVSSSVYQNPHLLRGQRVSADAPSEPAPSNGRAPAVLPSVPPELLGLAMAEVLRERGGRFLRDLDRARKDPLKEPLHDLRTSTRRLLSCLLVFEPALPPKKSVATRRQLKRIMKETSRCRDLQVQRAEAKTREALREQANDLKREHRSEAKRVRKVLEAFPEEKFAQRLHRMAMAVPGRLAEHPEAEGGMALLLGPAVALFGSIRDLAASEDAQSPEVLHQIRLKAKKLRYKMEVLQTLLGFDKQVLKEIQAVQDELGRIQDLDVLAARLAAHNGHGGALEDVVKERDERIAAAGALLEEKLGSIERALAGMGNPS